ncbi:putative nuclear RNA export factor SDE5 isoform X2 [Andrographis paniculata]|uniref:putative nuclear RNA export factor SDE5 isoform X2 n=1 Tax=Andrographis paniculata TaxID=175694 RepID=UPI0021E84809|nr:putative nuclear RNA export factor SDE5 isoform X2 [Andrographis paniculata]
MDLNVLHFGSSRTDEDEKNLRILLEAFGSVVSLEDIASIYSQNGQNMQSTAETLCNMQGGIAETSSRKPQDNVGKDNVEKTSFSSKPQDNVEKTSSTSTLSNSGSENDQVVNSKPKKCSATIGTVSSMIGKDYVRPRPQKTGSDKKGKPVKLHLGDFLASEIWEEKNVDTSHAKFMDRDMQEFIFKMLGDGFQLDRSVIQDVVGQCGYNMPMCVDKLLNLSTAAPVKSDDAIGISAGDVKPAAGSMKTGVQMGTILPPAEIEKKNIEREILNALFCAPDRTEEDSSPVRPVQQPLSRIVTKPPDEIFIEDFTFITRQAVNEKSYEENLSSYEEFHRVKVEYWDRMKECYKAAVEAYTMEDYENANELVEKGHSYMRKAQEANDKSAQKLIEDSDEEIISLNMHYLGPKDALRQMKLNLTTFSGLPGISCLKVVVGTEPGEAKDERRKHLITKLLEKEGIPWTEEGNGRIITIAVKEIDPRNLSFANK